MRLLLIFAAVAALTIILGADYLLARQGAEDAERGGGIECTVVRAAIFGFDVACKPIEAP